ncbi:MAG: chemotaxis response regulator protein-glutamate methylesterase [Eubacterium sp.]|nr:chemotaxis response regulator protein-glutamate methylesterase [Eubacterium sp.]
MTKIRVLVVDDSLMFRKLLVKHLNEDPDLEVVAEANDPFEARDAIIEYQPDVMTLDIELPKMNGIEFLQKLMPQYPLRTIVISTLSDRVFDALRAGAVDFVAKPHIHHEAQLTEFVKNELPSKIKIAACAKLRKNYVQTEQIQRVKPHIQPGNVKDMIIAIGASTGGTEATTEVLKDFGPDLPGVVITQHMPPGFTAMYAERLNQKFSANLKITEARSGDIVRPGHVLMAPGGDAHMKVIRKNGEYQILLRQGDKVNGHCPSVDVLFDSVADAAGENGIGIILTGMGGDGAKGLLKMRGKGAHTIGQDASTSVIYGMPKVAYECGAVEYQDRIGDIAKRTYALVERMQNNR